MRNKLLGTPLVHIKDKEDTRKHQEDTLKSHPGTADTAAGAYGGTGNDYEMDSYNTTRPPGGSLNDFFSEVTITQCQLLMI